MAGFDWTAAGNALGRKAVGAMGGFAEGETRMGKELAQQAALMSTAMANKAKADELNQRMQYRTPEFASRLAGELAGLTEPQANQLSEYMRSGGWGQDIERLAPDVAGPPQITPRSAPQWATPDTIARYQRGRAASLLNLAGTGDSNADQIAKALTQLTEQGRIDAAMGQGGVRGLNALSAALKGDMYSSAPQGVLSQETGVEAPNAAWVGERESAAAENRAQAANAYASAALSREKINTEKADADLKRSKIGQTSSQTITLPDGTVIQAGPKLTELQGKAQLFGSRAAEADRIISDLEGKYSPAAINAKMSAEGVWGIGGALGMLGNQMLSDEAQKAEQAQRDFVNAVLRQESGAVISEQEFSNARKQYFPQPGDSKAVLEQKARNRKTAIDGFRTMAGPAADKVRPQGPQPVSQEEKTAVLREARAAIAAGASRDAVIKRLKELGINDGSL